MQRANSTFWPAGEAVEPLFRNFFLALTTYLALLLLAVALERRLFIYAVILAPLGALIVTNPRFAVVAFVTSLFWVHTAFPGTTVLISDVIASLIILSALVDLGLRVSVPRDRLPRLTLCFAFVIVAMLVAGLINSRIDETIRPAARIALMLGTFLSLIRLIHHIQIRSILNAYLIACVISSMYAVYQFAIGAGIGGRAFALAPHILDELLMLALPVAVAFYLEASKRAGIYAASSAIITLGLIATQSRAPILFALFATGMTVWIIWKRAQQLDGDDLQTRNDKLKIRLRIKRAWVFGLFAIVMFLLFNSRLLEGALGRFNRLATTDPSGTFLLRIKLWGMALKAFLADPLWGLGPGSFKSLDQIFPSIRLDPSHYWVRGLSAHSLLLHYLAETGLVGGVALMTLFISQFRAALSNWKRRAMIFDGVRLSLLMVSTLMLVTTVLEAGWLWAHTSYIAALFLALIVSQFRSARLCG